MSRIISSAVAILAVTIASPGFAEDDFRQPVIVVVGHGSAEAPADYAVFEFEVQEEGKTEVEALRSMQTTRDRVEKGLRSLAGAKTVELRFANLSVDQARGEGCNDRGHDRDPRLSVGKCAIVGVVAQVDGELQIAPADQIGNAASLAAELGAKSVVMQGGEVFDYAGLEAKATAEALTEARKTAESVASAQGVRLGPLLRVQSHEAITSTEVVGLVVTGSRMAGNLSPQVLIQMKAPPVEAKVTYTVVYGIAR